jgi:hypothetical protein
MTMFNQHLLKLELSVEEYRKFCDQDTHAKVLQFNPVWFNLPAYMIARCPFCQEENVERLNTYSLAQWDNTQWSNRASFDATLVIHHCPHFVMVQSFINFNGLDGWGARGSFGPEVPYVYGHLLEKGLCLAVIHALPICRIEDDAFVPRYTLFLVSHFSDRPDEARRARRAFNAEYVNIEEALPAIILPPYTCQHWWDLRQWVAKGQLFWVDGTDPALGLRTGDLDAFLYGDIAGERTKRRFWRGPSASGDIIYL